MNRAVQATTLFRAAVTFRPTKQRPLTTGTLFKEKLLESNTVEQPSSSEPFHFFLHFTFSFLYICINMCSLFSLFIVCHPYPGFFCLFLIKIMYYHAFGCQYIDQLQYLVQFLLLTRSKHCLISKLIYGFLSASYHLCLCWLNIIPLQFYHSFTLGFSLNNPGVCLVFCCHQKLSFTSNSALFCRIRFYDLTN